MRYQSFVIVFGLAAVFLGCHKEPESKAQDTRTMNLIFMSAVGPFSKTGDVVQLRRNDANECDYFGSLTRDFNISIQKKRCGDIVAAASFVLPLSRAHTYADADGKLRTGYGAGDKLVFPLPAGTDSTAAY